MQWLLHVVAEEQQHSLMNLKSQEHEVRQTWSMWSEGEATYLWLKPMGQYEMKHQRWMNGC